MTRLFLTTLAIAVSTCTWLPASARAQSRTQNGATVGGVAGAVIGGIIGKQNDETPEGVLIGGAVGAIAGGLIGKAQDNELQRQRYAQQQAYYQQQQQSYVQQQHVVASGVSTQDVVNMSRSGVSEPIVLGQLQSRGVQRRLEVSDIIALHQQGVSDNLIAAYQSAPLATQLAAPQAAPQYVQQQNVIVREQPVIYSQPVVVHEYYRPVPVYHHHHRGYYGSSVRIGF